MHRKILESVLVIATALIILYSIQFSKVAERLNYIIYDSLQNVSGYSVERNSQESNFLQSKIAIVVIDDKSMDKMGMWPWSRSIHAELLNRLNTVSPKAVAFDILFTEPDSRYIEGDALFADAIRANGHVVLPALQIKVGASSNAIELQPPVPVLLKNIAQLAHVDAEVDSDGLVRGVFLKAGVNDSHLSALGLATVEVASDNQFPMLPGLRRNHDAKIKGGQWVRDHHALLSVGNSLNLFSTYSYVDVINNDSELDKLRDKIIFVGVTASGVATNLPIANTTNQSLISSVFYHASIANALLNDTAVTPLPDYAVYIAGTVLVLLSLLVYSSGKPGFSLFSTFIFIALTLGGCLFFLKQMAVWIPPASILVTLAISYPLCSWRRLVLMTSQLSQEKEQAEVTLQSIADGVITLNKDDEVLYMNPIAELLTGINNTDALNRPLESVFNIIDHSTGKTVTNQLLQYLKSSESGDFQKRHILQNKQGEKYTIRATVGKIDGSTLVSNGNVLAFSDVTETTNLLDHMSYQATHDILTGLPNRILLLERLIHSLATAGRHDYKVAVLFIDIDKFKNVNDGFGHKTGDQLLTEIASRLKANTRDEDTVARLGGDEFVVVLDQIPKTSDVAKVTQKIITSFQDPVRIVNHEFYVTCSIGIAIYPKDAPNADTLLKNADIAMYSAKERGRNNFQYFSANMNTIIQNRLLLEKELRIALDRNQLSLHYQPQVNIHTNKITGVEALLRWNHEKYGNVSPAEFIPLAEDTGLIVPIGEWVLRTACAQIKQWKNIIAEDFTVAVNLSPRQFLGQNVLHMLKDIINSSNIDAKHLKLEITEGLFVAKKTNIESTLEEFRQMGGTVSIDDFGTGYSSLSYLKRIPVDQVKIDRFFVQDISSNPRGSSLTKAIISMANDMNLDVIAEGVENIEQLKILKSQKCYHIQGFYFCPAVSAEDMKTLLISKQPFAEMLV
ncbi:MAG: EAL domain-containing protein [Gammaproteobacteria bacterium]|nr:EAL domain-containing protein [Gammaproteobacteria bacterium]